MGVSGQRHAPAALYSGERTPGIHCVGGWVGPKACLDTEARGIIVCLCRGSNLHHLVVQSLARHYTDWSTAAPLRFSRMWIPTPFTPTTYKKRNRSSLFFLRANRPRTTRVHDQSETDAPSPKSPRAAFRPVDSEFQCCQLLGDFLSLAAGRKKLCILPESPSYMYTFIWQ
jgi:hypothetical protein